MTRARAEQARSDGSDVTRASLYPHVLALATTLAVEPLLGVRHLSTAHWLRRFWSWPEERRGRWQTDRVEQVVAHAVSNVPFYRSQFGARQGSRALRISDLPAVDKARIRADMEAFRSEGWQQAAHISKTTGGTTGDPWRYPLDKVAWSHIYGAELYAWELTGYRYGEPVAYMGTPPSLVPAGRSLKTRVRLRLEGRVVSAAGMEIDRRRSIERVLRAVEVGAGLWYGYAGTIAAMADAVLEEGIPVPRGGTIVTTSETLQPQWRARIEQAFGALVVDEYGCNDGGVLAHTCPRGRFHLADNVSVVEVLDGDEPCPPGVEGDVTVTNLHARVLPFLRYKVGDRAVLGDGPCPCGRPGTTLERLVGRTWDRLRLPDGTELSAVTFNPAFMTTPHVRRWQVVQPEPATVKVRLDVEPGYGTDEAEHIGRYFRERCGADVRVEVTTGEPMERTPGGKHKVVVRLFD